jgi:hypothetical protein
MEKLEKIRAKITKSKDIREEWLRPFSDIQEGDCFDSYYYISPVVGESFTFWSLSYGGIVTSEVVEIIDEKTFRTKNSIYSIYTVEQQRDDKINNILK